MAILPRTVGRLLQYYAGLFRVLKSYLQVQELNGLIRPVMILILDRPLGIFPSKPQFSDKPS